MKRGESGLSLLVGIKKPSGMSSHDVVNRCRRIFGEKRVGHTGTLDPLATGVLPICVGPATRLDAYLVGHDKEYLVDIRFGYETTTDDIDGEQSNASSVPAYLDDIEYARSYINSVVGQHEQVPPKYSAIKINGQRSYKLARKGEDADVKPRNVEVFAASVEDVYRDDDGMLVWRARFSVSKGTYIRSLARDIGRDLNTAAHVSRLERTRSGAIEEEVCVSLETLESIGTQAVLDPVRVLGYRYAFGDDISKALDCGSSIPEEALTLFERLDPAPSDNLCACTSSLETSIDAPKDGELFSIIVANKLKAIYEYAAKEGRYKPACVFSIGVQRF